VSDGISRRDLFRFWRKPQPATHKPASPTLLRPPGAVFEALLLDTCSRCGNCVDACPRQAIFPLGTLYGPAQGTPAILARHAPCVVCEGLQCTQVCPTHALARVEVSDIDMGTAVIDGARCLTWKGESCGVCVEACPVPGALTQKGGHPVVDPQRCIGCGVCENVCPTPQASVVVVGSSEIVAQTST
jgi:MauM/NapG family ferredoxin protein